jgi:hypothetical protein
MLEVVSANEDELYEVMDGLLSKQPRIEAELARRHLKDGIYVIIPDQRWRHGRRGNFGL